MISFLHGKVVEALPTQAIIEVGGVGYEVLIPLSSYDKLPQPGQEVKLLTQLVVREDAHTLYGFMSAAERDLFRLLVHTVSGIGPKLALNVLSGISVTAFRGAVAGSDVKSLSQISGVGKKTASCVMLFGAGLPAIPVDTHVHRVSLRLGLVPPRASPDQATDLLEAAIPRKDHYAFHINLIRHGREVCKAPRPRCEICVLKQRCRYYKQHIDK